MIKLYSPTNLAELSLIESILEEENIPYFIHNDHFGSLEVGPPIDIYNMKTIMIEEAFEERARELLSDYLKVTKDDSVTMPSYSLFDKLRMAFETLLFTWFVPGKHRKRTKNGKEET
jgi:hypothetical protein